MPRYVDANRNPHKACKRRLRLHRHRVAYDNLIIGNSDYLPKENNEVAAGFSPAAISFF